MGSKKALWGEDGAANQASGARERSDMQTQKPEETLPCKVRGHDPLSPASGAEANAPVDRRVLALLTPRQREVAALLVLTGLSYKQIADRLELSDGTVRTHTEKIYRALGVHSRAELTVVLRVHEEAPALDAGGTLEIAAPLVRRAG